MSITKGQEEAFWKIYSWLEDGDQPFTLMNKGRVGRMPQPIGDGTLKSLEEYGLITVVTVTEHAWKYSGTDKTYYRLGLGPKAQDWIHGKIEVEKPCNKGGGWYAGICPRHKERHPRKNVFR